MLNCVLINNRDEEKDEDWKYDENVEAYQAERFPEHFVPIFRIFFPRPLFILVYLELLEKGMIKTVYY
jgi:hypothetical protein